MNYEQALAALRHARTKNLLERKKVCNATWLRRVYDTTSALNHVHLELFDKHILTWKPSGNIVLDNKGWWTWCTKDRYQHFLPRGFNLYQNSPYWFIRTPTGTRVFRNGMELTPTGDDIGLPWAQTYDAASMLERVHEYTKCYTARLVRGELPQPELPITPLLVRHSTPEDLHHCFDCAMAEKQGDHQETQVFRQHLVRHVEQNEAPSTLMRLAYAHSKKYLWAADVGEAIELSWTEKQKHWRKPRNARELIEQTELKMTTPETVRRDIRPRAHIKDLRRMLKDFLLESLGFEKMDS